MLKNQPFTIHIYTALTADLPIISYSKLTFLINFEVA